MMKTTEQELLGLIKKARFVFVCGNGGSAANAEHFTNDLFSKGVSAICLNSNVSIITMIANDYGYQYIYGNQLKRYGTKEDLLITISCSGYSPNIVYAQEIARGMGMPIYPFETFEPGKKDYGKLEDKHSKLIHKIKELL